MSIEKQPGSSTEAQQFLSSYPIPAPIRLPPARDLIRAELPENGTEKIQEICLSVHITVAIGKEAVSMPRMSKKRKLEWAFFLNHRDRITYNDLCRKCAHGCKQSFREPPR